VVALPEDMLAEESEAEDARPHRRVAASPGSRELEVLRERLRMARRPLAIVGEGGWTARAGEDLLAFAEANAVPVAASFRCQDFVDNRSPAYAGHAGLGMDPALARRIEEADLLLAVGGRLGEIPSAGWTLVSPPVPRQALVHVHPDPGELGAVFQPALGIVSGLEEFAAAARELPPDPAGRQDLVAQARGEYEANLRQVRELPGELQMAGVMAHLRERLPPEAIVTCGAGNFTIWAHRYYEFSRHPTQLAPRSGAMGYGVPAAVAAKALRPDVPVVCLAGDGDFLMTGQELATAVQEELPVVVLVVNNAMYGTIRMHQERRYPGRVVGTDLRNPDFVAYARAFGAHGALVERTEDFADAFEEALTCGRPAVLELRVDPEAITPRGTLSELRAAAT
jgi:acetolactate synthase-1/2/3 large subunit